MQAVKTPAMVTRKIPPHNSDIYCYFKAYVNHLLNIV